MDYTSIDFTSIGSLLVAFVALIISIFNASKKEAKEVTTQMATIMAKLDIISEDIRDLKNGNAEMKRDIMKNHDDIIRLKASLDTAWKRIDEINLTLKKEGTS